MRTTNTIAVAILAWFCSGVAHGAVTEYCCDAAAEQQYLADLAALPGSVTVVAESFEDGGWVVTRSTTTPSVSSNGVTWSRPGDGLRTSVGGGDAHAGDYLMFAWDDNNVIHPIPDGFTVQSNGSSLHGFGGWYKGSGGKIAFIADDDPNRVDFTGEEATVIDWKFLGFIDTAPFTKLELKVNDEMGGEINIFFTDDVNIGMTGAAPEEGRVFGLPDLNGNSSSDVGVLSKNSATGEYIFVARDSMSGAFISSVSFGTDPVVDAVVIGDIGGNALPELAVLGTRPSGQARLLIRDTLTGVLENTVFFGSVYASVDLSVVPDTTGNTFDEIAVLGTSAAGGVRVQARDSVTGVASSTVYFGSRLDARQLAILPDSSGGGFPEIAVHGVDTVSQQSRVQIKDSDTAALIRNVYFGTTYDPVDIAPVETVAGGGIAELSQRSDTSAVRALIKDTSGNPPVSAAYMGSTDRPVRILGIADSNASGVADLAVLVEDSLGRAAVRVREGSDGSFIRNVFSTQAGTPLDFDSVGDLNSSGHDELAILGLNTSIYRVQIKDPDSGQTINVVDF